MWDSDNWVSAIFFVNGQKVDESTQRLLFERSQTKPQATAWREDVTARPVVDSCGQRSQHDDEGRAMRDVVVYEKFEQCEGLAASVGSDNLSRQSRRPCRLWRSGEWRSGLSPKHASKAALDKTHAAKRTERTRCRKK